MTSLRIDTAKFKAACEDVRYQMQSRDELNQKILARGVRRYYEIVLSNDWRAAEEEVEVAAPEVDPADELRSQLRVAAQAAQQFGATASQIDYIVALAVRANDFNVLAGGRLTKGEASRIIDVMKGDL